MSLDDDLLELMEELTEGELTDLGIAVNATYNRPIPQSGQVYDDATGTFKDRSGGGMLFDVKQNGALYPIFF